MSKRMFNEEQIQELTQNKHVLKCSPKAITYCPEFKLRAVKAYEEEGLPPQLIFAKHGFNLALIGNETPRHCLRDWRKIYQAQGKKGLLNDRRGTTKGDGGGRPRTKGLSDREKIEYLEAQVAYLKAEVDFLAKLRAAKKE